MARKLTAEQQAEIAKIKAQQATDAARYGKHAKLGVDMRSEFLDMAWAIDARLAAFAQVAEAWGVDEGGILRLPADREAMTRQPSRPTTACGTSSGSSTPTTRPASPSTSRSRPCVALSTPPSGSRQAGGATNSTRLGRTKNE